jgi:hypothetical protein
MKFLEILSLKNLLDVSRPFVMTINGQCESPESMTFPESKDQVLDHDPQKPDPTKAWCPKCKVHSTEIIEHHVSGKTGARLAYAGTVCRECGPWMFAGLIGRPSIAGKLRVTCILTGCAGTAFILFVIYRVGGEEIPKTLKVFLFVAHLIFWPMLLIAFFRCHKIHKIWLTWAKDK